MKSKTTLLTLLISASLLASASAFAAGPGGGRGNAGGTPVRNGSGSINRAQGNPNSTGTPVRDGSGKATAPGKGAKDGTGNGAACPNP